MSDDSHGWSATILIVDDDAGLRRLIERALTREGFLTATAGVGTEVLKWLTENRADLMLLDLELPDTNGKQLTDDLAQAGCLIPFVIITGQGDERVAVEMMKRGALDYLIKDAQLIEFVPTVVRRALAQVEKDRRLALAEDQMQRLQKQILELNENEQRRIGRDLHDGLGQHLTALELLSQALAGKLKTAAPQLVPSAQEICRQIRETVRQTRLLSHNLSPVPLESDGLMTALSELAAGTQAIAGVDCKLVCPQAVLIQNATVAMHLYRIAQEAVNNALKHSQASAIVISLFEEDSHCILSIRDNGCGFTGLPRASGPGLGLAMMQHRAQLIGAKIEIQPCPGEGVQVVTSLPK